MKLRRVYLWLAGGLVVGAVLIGVMFRGGTSGTTAPDPAAKSLELPSSRRETADIADDGEVKALLKQLEELRARAEPVPRELQVKADHRLNDKKVSYGSRIRLALLAYGEDGWWASKHIQIIFRNEISKKPFATISELFKLVPEGPIQIEVADVVAQAVARTMTAADAPDAAEWVAGLPDGPRKKAISMLGSCLASKGDLASLRSLEQHSKVESVKSSFAWYRADLERSNPMAR
jgi:hypothetical protein